MIDEQGYRLNVGIVLTNGAQQLLWCRRVGMRQAWQFPQGGMQANETPTQAMFRELEEELGLTSDQVQVLAQSQDWLYYQLPPQFRRPHSQPLCIGQKQRWFLLQLNGSDRLIQLQHCKEPEFDQFRWVDYWYPVLHVIDFKREVYAAVLEEFKTMVIGKTC